MSSAHAIDITKEPRRIDDLAPRAGRIAALAGLAVFALGVLLGAISEGDEFLPQFLRSYLLNFTYFTSLALGALFFVMIQHVTKAGWSVVVRRLAEVVAATMPLLAVLSLPILIAVMLGYREPFVWANKLAVEQDETGLIAGKAAYLNRTFFLIRAVIYFAAWIWLSRYFLARSVEQDATGDVELTRRMERLSAPGLFLYAFTTAFFSYDFLMSINPKWFSTIFGVYYFAGAVVSFCALLGIMIMLVQRAGRIRNAVTAEHYQDVGKLMFAFIVFWAYIAYSQYMLIWYANLPEETEWFQVRQSGIWARVSVALIFGHFFLPFLALMSRHAKRRKWSLLLGAVWVLLMHWLDLFWLVAPPEFAAETSPPHGSLHLLDATCFVGLAGVFVWAVARRLSRHSLIPERDPRLGESLAFENF